MFQDDLSVVEATRFRLTTRRTAPDVYVIAVNGELDMFRTPMLKQLFLDLVGCGARGIVLDLGETSFVDSTALGLLMSLPREIGHSGGAVIVACENQHIRRAFAVAGADRRLTVVPKVGPALDHLDGRPPAA